jgi:prepilin-type N-terminal cleavage/methylation domain-containing protein
MTRRGDTLIEVMLSISIFAVVALLTINLMNDGINTAQRTLEVAMARNEIDAQAEALRFIHHSYVAERQMTSDESDFKYLWKQIVKKANKPSALEHVDTANEDGRNSFDINDIDNCQAAYLNPTSTTADAGHLAYFNSFILNTRMVLPQKVDNYMGTDYNDLVNDEVTILYKNNPTKFSSPSLYPRIIYRKDGSSDSDTTENIDMNKGEKINNLYNRISTAEGIWIDVAGNKGDNGENSARSDYYDFYIRTCWQGAGMNVPTTLTTVVRLYNPEVLE